MLSNIHPTTLGVVCCMLVKSCRRGYVSCFSQRAISRLSSQGVPTRIGVTNLRKPQRATNPPSSDLPGDPLRISADRTSRFLVELVMKFSKQSPKNLVLLEEILSVALCSSGWKAQPLAAEGCRTKGLAPESRSNSVIRHCMLDDSTRLAWFTCYLHLLISTAF
jgi:hypothetical protein